MPDRRHHQAVEKRRFGVSGDRVEKCGSIAAEILRAGQQSKVGVQPGRALVVVAGAEMHISADAGRLAAHDQRDFGVHFQSGQTIQDMGAGFFEISGPADVAFFVEARGQLNQHGYLLAAFGRADQGLHHRRFLAAGAIEGLLDREHIRIFGRRLDKPDHRIKGVVGMVQQQVAFAEDIENAPILRKVGAAATEAGGR